MKKREEDSHRWNRKRKIEWWRIKAGISETRGRDMEGQKERGKSKKTVWETVSLYQWRNVLTVTFRKIHI